MGTCVGRLCYCPNSQTASVSESCDQNLNKQYIYKKYLCLGFINCLQINNVNMEKKKKLHRRTNKYTRISNMNNFFPRSKRSGW